MTNTMQRRHFEVIAGIIAQSDVIDKEALASMFAESLGQFNDRFQKERFIQACLTGKMGKGRSHKNVGVK